MYLAGDWNHRPSIAALGKRFEDAGYTLTSKWWDPEVPKQDFPTLCVAIDKCDVYILDMRSPEFDEHAFGGSILGVGLAFNARKQIRILLPPGAAKPKTSLLNGFVVTSEDKLFG